MKHRGGLGSHYTRRPPQEVPPGRRAGNPSCCGQQLVRGRELSFPSPRQAFKSISASHEKIRATGRSTSYGKVPSPQTRNKTFGLAPDSSLACLAGRWCHRPFAKDHKNGIPGFDMGTQIEPPPRKSAMAEKRYQRAHIRDAAAAGVSRETAQAGRPGITVRTTREVAVEATHQRSTSPRFSASRTGRTGE